MFWPRHLYHPLYPARLKIYSANGSLNRLRAGNRCQTGKSQKQACPGSAGPSMILDHEREPKMVCLSFRDVEMGPTDGLWKGTYSILCSIANVEKSVLCIS